VFGTSKLSMNGKALNLCVLTKLRHHVRGLGHGICEQIWWNWIVITIQW